MQRIITSEQMREIERLALESGRVSEFELMESAGRGAAAAIQSWHAEGAGARKACVLSGPGNNGGDGYAIARILAEAGWQACVWALGCPPEAAASGRMREMWQSRGGVRPLSEFTGESCSGGAVVVDALFGIGLSRPLGDVPRRALGTAFRHSRVVAVDMPSGFDADTGRFVGGGEVSSACKLTVTFEFAKPGHFLAEGGHASGRVQVVPLGLDSELAESRIGADMPRLAGKRFLRDARVHVKRPLAHKYDHGHALVLSGGTGKGGAARLAARAALRVGAGLATLGTPSEAVVESASQLNSVMLSVVDTAKDLERILSERRVASICVGPGFGTGRGQAALVAAVLESKVPAVLDADAITLLAADREGLFRRLRGGILLTPHDGEFRRLFGGIAERLKREESYSKLDAVREAARHAGCTVMLKGPDTVAATPEGRATIVPLVKRPSSSWLATAGSGDVLAGFAAGLLARGYGVENAASCAALLLAESAAATGPGLISEDLPDALPSVMRRLACSA